MRSPTCRARARAGCYASWSINASVAWAGDQDVQVDVRVVSSTSRDLNEEIAAGRLREDLFHRLNVVPLRVPGLTERREDIPALIAYYIDRLSEASGLPRRKLADDAYATLQVQTWPGNVRQLRNVVERMLILASGNPDDPITADMLPARGQRRPGGRRTRRRADHRLAAARSAGAVRTRIPRRSDHAVRRQHLAHGGLHRHGALGASPQAEVLEPGCRRLEEDA